MRSIPNIPLVVLAFMIGVAPVSTRAQSVMASDTSAVERRLSSASGEQRIPLLVTLAKLRRDEPARVLQLCDEALRLLKAHPSASDEVQVRVERSHALETTSDYPAALSEAQRAEQLARGVQDDRLLGEAMYQVATVEWRMATYAVARGHAEQARALLEPYGKSGVLVRTLSLIGAIHHYESDLEAGLAGYVAALHMGEALGDEIAAARAHNNIGLVLLDLGRKEESLVALKRALAIHERLGPKANLTNTLNNVGLALIELDRPREALPFLERALVLDREAGNPYGEAKEFSNIGYVYERLKQPARALEYHQRALAIRERIGDKDGIVRTRGALAEVRLRNGDVRGAIALFEQSTALAAEINNRRDEADQLAVLSQARATIGDTAGAFVAYRRMHELQAQLNDSATRTRVAELETQYQTQARQRDLDAMASLAESRREKLTSLIIASALLLGLLVLLGVLYALRVKAQNALAESEARYRTMFQAALVPTFLVDPATRHLLDLNAPARALCGVTAEGSTVGIDTLEPDYVRRAFTQLLQPGAGTNEFADSWTDESSRVRWAESRASSVTVGGKACLLVSVADTTEAHLQEEARLRVDKMEALGVLAGGIAHDFNNALAAIVGHVSLAKEGDPAEARELLDVAEEAAIGARRLTSQLLAFAKGGQPMRRTADLGRLLRDTVALAGAGASARISTVVPDGLWHAELDSGQFSQVVSNLVINACQATGEGGRIEVRASNCMNDPLTGVPGDQDFVRVDVEDNGPGIPQAIRDRIFDPYFTTKAAGSGLGLATAFTICRNHSGLLTFESREGEGTTFSAYFPASAAREEAPGSTPVQNTYGVGSILVLDDEPLIQQVLKRMLEQWGYSVEVVSDGAQAVKRYVERLGSEEPFGLLIMDLTIPGGMGGRAAMAEILQHDPHARAIVVSGYSDDPTMANFREAGFAAALAKPFQRAELARIVSDVMHRAPIASDV